MELWREQMLLEQTNLTRDGAWLELVKRKVERKAEATKAVIAPAKPKQPSRRQKRIAELKAQKAKRRARAMMRAERRANKGEGSESVLTQVKE